MECTSVSVCWRLILFNLEGSCFFIIIALSIAYRNDIEAFPSLSEIFETKGEILSNHGNSESELASSPLPVGTPLDHICLPNTVPWESRDWCANIVSESSSESVRATAPNCQYYRNPGMLSIGSASFWIDCHGWKESICEWQRTRRESTHDYKQPTHGVAVARTCTKVCFLSGSVWSYMKAWIWNILGTALRLTQTRHPLVILRGQLPPVVFVLSLPIRPG